MKAVSDIVSPSGIDLNPDPPSPVRLSKRAGILALFIVFVVVALIGYGIYNRGQKQFQIGFHPDEASRLTAATDAGKIIASQIPNGSIVRSGAQELVVPEPEPVPSPKVTPTYYGTVQPPNAIPPPRELTFAEKRLIAAYEREQEALNSSTVSRDGFNGSMAGGSSRGSLPTAAGDLSQMTNLLQAMQGPAGQGKATAGLPKISLGGDSATDDGYESQNMQDRKEAFLAAARKAEKNSYLESVRTPPITRYELKAGWDIPAILEQALNSDLPGEIKALVRENVYDTASGRFLLIPQGARLVGLYDSRVSYGQDGLQVAWNRIIFPDASSINLEGMSGQDAKGFAGLRHDVDHHYKRLLGFGLLTSLFSASFQLSQSRRGGLIGYPSASETTGSAVGRELSQLGSDVTRRNLNVQPTIKVPIGYRFNVRVNQDMLFEGPYRPLSR